MPFEYLIKFVKMLKNRKMSFNLRNVNNLYHAIILKKDADFEYDLFF